MKTLINHLLLNNLDEIVSKSIFNCHCKGLHSIMLLDAPEKTIRLYIAKKGNDMYRNNYIDDMLPRDDMSIGFHSHNCNLTLECIKGEFHNWLVKEVDFNTKGFNIDKWEYRSHIITGNMGFEHIDISRLETISYNHIKKGESVFLNAKDIHTVACNPLETSAWLVYEGKKDIDYKSYNWSINNLSKVNSDGLYVKPSYNEIIELLIETDLI